MGSNVNSVLVDASVWVAYFDKNDVLYYKAGKLLDRTEDKVRILTDYVVQEVITIFLYKKQPQLIQELLNIIQHDNTEIISVESVFLNSLMTFIKEQNYQPKMSLTDWSLVFLAGELGLPLYTFDKQLQNTHRRLDNTPQFD
ncbi:MAG: PIN domain-containing protein [Patescibacteria group bacterium]|jgi:predicted nucleic acid-binding protein